MIRQVLRTMQVVAAILLAGAALWYLTAPPKGLDGYRERAAATSESLRSQVETSRLWAWTFAAGKATRPATLVAFEEAEADATAAASGFEAFEPPGGGLHIRRRLGALSRDVTKVLADLRIAGQQERWDDVDALAEPLPRLADRLRRFEARVEP